MHEEHEEWGEERVRFRTLRTVGKAEGMPGSARAARSLWTASRMESRLLQPGWALPRVPHPSLSAAPPQPKAHASASTAGSAATVPRNLLDVSCSPAPGHRPAGGGGGSHPQAGVGCGQWGVSLPRGGEAETATKRGGRRPRTRGRRSSGLFRRLRVEGARSPGDPVVLAAPPAPGEGCGGIALSPPAPPRPGGPAPAQGQWHVGPEPPAN